MSVLTEMQDLIKETANKLKWGHDGIDTYETWWLGDEDNPAAIVSPEYNETRRISGGAKPDRWKVMIGGKSVGEWPKLGDAKKAAERHISTKP